MKILTILFIWLSAHAVMTAHAQQLTLNLANAQNPAQQAVDNAAPTTEPSRPSTTASQATATPTPNAGNANRTDAAANADNTNDPANVPESPHDPDAPTLLDAQAPDDNALSTANRELLAKNAELERQVDTLSTQNNVLVAERSGQLFLYGAMTAVTAMLIGFMLARIFARKERW